MNVKNLKFVSNLTSTCTSSFDQKMWTKQNTITKFKENLVYANNWNQMQKNSKI